MQRTKRFKATAELKVILFFIPDSKTSSNYGPNSNWYKSSPKEAAKP
jgi:predicted NAD-dependent protein-ADP-ribosyltransferase YbiA (DUF1768 family)